MSVISLPEAALDAASVIAFELVRSQDVLLTASGVAQITSYPDRRWFARLQVTLKSGADLRAWALALDQLSDRSNVFALSPPYYEGPSTGYAGPTPRVNGASQLGLSLAVDGLTPSTAILAAGDFISFDVTSAGGNTNRQLIKVAADVTSNGAGEAAISLVTPIRQAPADNATVNIQTPSAFFMLATSRSTVELQLMKRASFAIDAEERIFP